MSPARRRIIVVLEVDSSRDDVSTIIADVKSFLARWGGVHLISWRPEPRLSVLRDTLHKHSSRGGRS